MRVVEGDPARWGLSDRGRAVTVGVYDGVHEGHRHVIELVVEEAAERDLEVAVLTFDPHPLSVVAPDVAPRLLTTIDQRVELLEAEGVEVVAVLPFSPRVRAMRPAEFAGQVLAGAMHARLVTVGEDFRFGLDRTGNVESLSELGGGLGFETTIVPLVGADAPTSSTRIRRLVAEGDVAGAGSLLGRLYEVRGVVVKGDGRGATIGVPTANLEIPPSVAVPARGVYAVWAGVAPDASRPGVANIGVRPTFDGASETLEVHLLEGGEDLYGERLAVRFVERIRDEQRFSGVDELVAQIHDDIASARALLGR